MKTILAVLALLACFAAPATAGTIGPHENNNSRIYGVVVTSSNLGLGERSFTVYTTTPGDEIRFDCESGSTAGCAGIVPGQYVVVHGELRSRVGCLDGPNAWNRPMVIWRWSGTSWEIHDHDSLTWVPWP